MQTKPSKVKCSCGREMKRRALEKFGGEAMEHIERVEANPVKDPPKSILTELGECDKCLDKDCQVYKTEKGHTFCKGCIKEYEIFLNTI